MGKVRDMADSPTGVPISLTVNGQEVGLTVGVTESLVDVLRTQLRLTGTKIGCGAGACGACTVLRDGKRILACLAPAVLCDGCDVRTIEGLAADGTVHPLQAAFVEHDALQCGFCTPGQIMSACGLLAETTPDQLRPDFIREAMSGNLCRCGAYSGIVDAIAEVGRTPR